jgi:nucleoside-diphosphate-sugar epimerase
MYLVTGGAGFFGSRIIRVSLGKRLRVMDDLARENWKNLSTAKNEIDLVKGDISDLTRKAMQEVHIVLHQAALRTVPLSMEELVLVNVEGTLNV